MGKISDSSCESQRFCKQITLVYTEIATEALREAIINAFCHRDYRDPDYVQVAVYKDRVEPAVLPKRRIDGLAGLF